MFLESFLQDIRIGLRVLIKEKGFCALAVTVLTLGICGVATMFSVVNGVMIRGFSFPTADRLMSIQFIDPSQNNFFGVASQIFALDYEEVRASQKSFEHVAAYINESSIAHHSGNSPGLFGATNMGLCLVLGWTLDVFSSPSPGATPMRKVCAAADEEKRRKTKAERPTFNVQRSTFK